MSAREEPSYLAFARANVRNSLTSSATIVRELVARIDRDASALKAAQPRTITTAEELDTMPIGTVVHWKGTTATRSFESEPAGLNWVAIGSAMGYSVHEFNLPVTVLHEPTP